MPIATFTITETDTVVVKLPEPVEKAQREDTELRSNPGIAEVLGCTDQNPHISPLLRRSRRVNGLAIAMHSYAPSSNTLTATVNTTAKITVS